jgi:lysophospholipase L1-like esterase
MSTANVTQTGGAATVAVTVSRGLPGPSGSDATVTNANVNTAIEANPSASRTSLGLGTLATQSGTFSGESSGTNTGDQDLSGLSTPATVAAQIDARENLSRYPKRRIAFLGDSITSWWGNNGLGAAANSLGGFGGVAQALTGYGFDCVPSSTGFNFATGGFTLTQIQTTWLPEVLASGADVCFLHAGTNGSGETAAAKFAKWAEIIEALDAANILPIAATVIPGGDVFTSDYRNVIRDFNNQIRAYCIANNVLLCDWHDDLTDSSTGLLSTDYSADKTHPNYTGTMPMAMRLAKTLAPITTPLNRFPSVSDVKWLSANPYLTGDVSEMPTSWTKANVATGTATASKVARSDGRLGTALQIVVAGGGAKTDGCTVSCPAATSGYADGDMVKAIIEIEFDADGWAAWTWGWNLTVIGGTHHAYRSYHPDFGSTASIAALTAPIIRPVATTDRTIILETPAMSVGVGATSISTTFNFRGAGTFRVLRGGIYKA